MKKFILSLSIILLAVSLGFSQSPYAFKFQGLARDSDGKPMIEEFLQIRLSILRDDPVSGSIVYEETHDIQTSSHGLFSVSVGEGSSSQLLEDVDWGSHLHHLQVELKRPQDPDFTDMGTHQLQSVPYALHAASADDVDDADADSLNEIQHLQTKAFGNTLGYPDSVQVVLSKSTDTFTLVDINPFNELQELEVGSITIVPTTFDMAEIGLKISQSGAPEIVVDAEWGNEFQDVAVAPAAWPDSWIQLWNPDGKKHDQALITDTDPANELQMLDLLQIMLPGGLADHELQLLEQTANNPPMYKVTNAILLPDSDPKNELQQLKIDTPPTNPWATELSLLQPVIVTPPGGNPMLKWVPFMSPVLINDTDPANELQEMELKTIKDPVTECPETSLRLSNKVLSTNGNISLQVQDEVVLPDADPENELQRLEIEVEEGPCGARYDLNILHQQKDTSGFLQWEVYNSIELPDGDSTNELQVLELESLGDDFGTHILHLGHIVCDSFGFPQTVTDDKVLLFDLDPLNELQRLSKNGSTIDLSEEGGSITLNDDDPTNELQELIFDPNSDVLSITKGNEVDLSPFVSPWVEDVLNNLVEYAGTAVSDAYETIKGGVVIDDTGISRHDTLTGINVSNICMERSGGTVYGKFEVLNNGITVAELRSCPHQSAVLDGLGPNGFYNTLLSHLDGYPNHGLIGVVDAFNVMRAGSMIDEFGNGVVFGDIKNFRMPHPDRPGKEIWYASLEAPEAAAYERGVGQLKDGKAFIELSEHFVAVTNTSTMTVSLTPHSADTYGLAVVEKTPTGFKVKELAKGSGSFGFDWEVKCVRKGFENYEPVRDEEVFFEKRRTE